MDDFSGSWVDVYWDSDGWDAQIYPRHRGELWVWVDFDDDGIFTFKVSSRDLGRYECIGIENWIVEDCYEFNFNSQTFESTKDLSRAMWLHEVKMASTQVELDDILECCGQFYNDVKRAILIKQIHTAKNDHIISQTQQTLKLLGRVQHGSC